MRIFKLCEINNHPRKNDNRYETYRVYNNELYMEAECNVDCELEEDVSDEEFEQLVEEELEDIIETLKTYGRYPINGIPKYIAY